VRAHLGLGSNGEPISIVAGIRCASIWAQNRANDRNKGQVISGMPSTLGGVR
jgi:hypothetical protein